MHIAAHFQPGQEPFTPFTAVLLRDLTAVPRPVAIYVYVNFSPDGLMVQLQRP